MTVPLEQLTAVILAGGFGTRVRHLLPHLPKPMAPVAGRPFVEWLVRFLSRQGLRRVIISTGYLAETIHSHFSLLPLKKVTVRCVKESTPLGTAGGFLNCVKESGGAADAWLVLNGDSLILTDVQPLARRVAHEGADAAVLALDMPDASRYGTLELGPQGDLIRFAEKKPGAATINAGVYLFGGKALSFFPVGAPCSFETDAFPTLLQKGARISVVRAVAPFLDIGTESSLKEAEGFILKNRAWFDEE